MSIPSPSFYAGRRCLVLGGTGFVGSYFVEALLAAGAIVRVPIHRRPPAIHDPRIEYVPADLSLGEDCLRIMAEVEMVVHAAGTVGSAVVGPQDVLLGIDTNVHLTVAALHAAWQSGVKRVLVFSSSTGYPVADHPVREDEFWTGPVHPSYGGYGWMRRYVEQLAQFVGERSGMHMCIVRPGAIYGPRENFDPKVSHVIPSLIRRADAREAPFVVWGTGDEVRDFLHVSDLVRGCLLAMELGRSCDPVNIALGEGITVRRLVDLVMAASDFEDADICFDASKPTTIPVRLIDCTKARRELGFIPAMPLADGLAETVRWFRSGP